MKNKIFTITGPSGSGKTSIANNIFSIDEHLVSFTTRPPRPGEVDGIDYYFLNENNISELEKEGDLIEHIIYNGFHYGYTRSEIIEKLSQGDVVTVLTKEGVEDFLASEFSENIVPFFIDISLEKVKNNLKHRNDSEENIKKRISLFKEESLNKEWFENLNNSTIIRINDTDDVERASFKFKEYIKKQGK